MKKGEALKMMKKMPSGMYFTVSEKSPKEIVPTTLLNMTVPRSSGVMSEKKFTLTSLMIRADAHMLNSDRKKMNSNTDTDRLVSISFVRPCSPE